MILQEVETRGIFKIVEICRHLSLQKVVINGLSYHAYAFLHSAIWQRLTYLQPPAYCLFFHNVCKYQACGSWQSRLID